MRHGHFDAEHEIFRDSVRRFFRNEIAPHREAWHAQCQVDRQAYQQAGQQGLLCMFVDPAYGGAGVMDFRYEQIVIEENQRHGDPGFFIHLHSRLVAPYIAVLGTEEQKRRFLPGCVSGETILGIAMTEAGAGSDLAGMKCRADDRGDHFLLNGQKTYISNGIIGDVFVVAARTNPAVPRQIGLFLVERGMDGFSRGRKLKKMGLESQDTAELFFENVRVPKANVLGDPARGFYYLMQFLAEERLIGACSYVANCQIAFDITMDYIRERKIFGQSVGDFQVNRFRMADMRAQIDIAQVFVDSCVRRHNEGQMSGDMAARAKLFTSELEGRVMDDCVQLHGGAGYMDEYPISRMYRNARISRIYAGSSEVMREIISRAIGLDPRKAAAGSGGKETRGLIVGPLSGCRIIEIAGLGPGPFCGMMLGDMGADVIRVDRPGTSEQQQRLDPLCRNRRSVVIDLKSRRGVEVLLRLVEGADALYEGFRPGVAERLGFGPQACLARNERLVYGRMTGWGQDGPLAGAAGHDINYIALAGALAGIGRPGGQPTVPLNLLGDFGGGGMLLAFGLVCALLEARGSGKGQVIDAAMIDGSNALMATFHGFRAMGLYDDRPGTHFLSGAAHYYDSYETLDGKYVTIGALEQQFYELLIEKAGLDRERFAPFRFSPGPGQAQREDWSALKAELAAVFRRRTRDEWCALLEGSDACFAPVLTAAEASRHPHHVARRSFIEVGGVLQHAPAPRFSRTPASEPCAPPSPGKDAASVLAGAGFSNAEIDELRQAGVIGP